MRIAICLSQFYPALGGAERQLQQLGRAWVARGNPTLVFTRRVPGLPAREQLDGLEVRREIAPWGPGPLFGATFLTSLRRCLRRARQEFDVVLAGQLPWEAVATGWTCPALSKPSVARVALTGPRGDAAQIAGARGTHWLRRQLRANTAFVAASEEARRELEALGCAPTAICGLANGVDTARFAPNRGAREPIVLWVGRLVANKRPQTMLAAWRHWPGRGAWRLLIAGEGPLAAELARQIREEQLANVELLGAVADMPALYRRAELLVVTSAAEGCSNAILEAQAAGVCPVVTEIPANLSLVRDGQEGRTYPVDDASRLAQLLDELGTEAEPRRRLGEASRQRVVVGHDLEAVAERYLALFDRLLRGQPPCAESAG